MNQTIAERNDGIVHLALKKIGQTLCRHEFMLWQRDGHLAVCCRHCLLESRGFVVGDEPETVKEKGRE